MQTNVLEPLTSFIGRGREIADVRDHLTAARLVTITGAGGCGKTRLAFRVGAELLANFADGVWVIELASLTDAAQIISTCAAVLDVPKDLRSPAERDGDESALGALLDHLRDKQLLVVLDNCEHLLDGCGAFVDTVLRACPNVRILATSRARLNAEGEITWRLPELDEPDAIRLFEDRARQIDATFSVSDPDAIADICRKLDGVPLAIELAAARTSVLSPTEIAERLTDVFRLLKRGQGAERQDALWTTIDWSYRLLTEKEQAFFRRLYVFSGGFSLEAAEAISPDNGDVLDLISTLVDRSLVVIDRHGDRTRYRLLEVIREFAGRNLEAANESDETRGRHARFFVSLTEEASKNLVGGDQRRWIEVLRREESNIGAALDWSEDHDLGSGVRLVAAMMPFWATVGERRDRGKWVELIISAPDEVAPASLRSRALSQSSMLLAQQGEFKTSEALAQTALALAEQSGDAGAAALALRNLSAQDFWRGRYDSSTAFAERSVASARADHDDSALAFALVALGRAVTYRNELVLAHSLYEEGIALCEQTGDRHRGADLVRQLGGLLAHEGDLSGARQKFDAAAEAALEIGCTHCAANTAFSYADLARREGDVQVAARRFADALTIWTEQGTLTFTPACFEGIAALASDGDRHESAVAMFAVADRLRAALGIKRPPFVATGYAVSALDGDAAEQYMAQLRAALGEQRFTDAWERGRTLRLREASADAIDIALELAGAQPPPGIEPAVGTKLYRERYEPIEVIGAGGQGEVIRALDHQHERQVALKIRPAGEPEHRRALLSEARILLGLRPHAGLPLVRDDFFVDDGYVVVMDWIEGTDLRTLVDHQGDPGLPVGSVIGYLSEIAEALDHLHSHDPPITHGDVKPANCILNAQGKVILVDFGIATGAGDARVLGSGTRGFVAPEVAAGQGPSPAADVFGLAATAYALLTGRSPEGEWAEFEGVDPGHARALARAIRRGLSVDPARRPRRATELVERLRSWRESELPTGTLTFLLTDIEESTRLWELNRESMAKALVRHESIIADAVESAGGRFIKSRGEGDSTVSVFTRATDAAKAALDLQRALTAESWPKDAVIRVRASLHTGEAQLREGDYYGPTLNRAARLRSVAAGGQIVVSEVTAGLVSDSLPRGTTLADLGPHELKGLARAERVFALHTPDVGRTSPPSPEPEPARGRHNLPAQLTTFIGREAEIAELETLLGSCRMLTITGAGGCGKTRVAFEVANELLTSHDGVWVAELAALSNPELVPDAIASALGLVDAPGEAAASEVTERHPTSPMNALIEFLAPRRSVLVLDNCEHIVEGCAKVVSRLLRSCPDLKVLATSREPLHADGEIAWRLPSLSTPDSDSVGTEQLMQYEAVRLFDERARAANPAFRLSETERVPVARICRRLEGIPLAIELAASRIRAMTPADLAARLEDRFRLLTPAAAGTGRHQTLRAAIDWSHDMLEEREQLLFRRLAVFSGGWTLEAAETVCANEALEIDDVPDALTSLVDRSLVVMDLSKSRYRMLEMIRDYARDKLDASHETADLKQRHLEFFADLVERAEPLFSGGAASIEEQRVLFEKIDAEQENVRSALSWAVEEDPDRGLRIVGALPQVWLSRGMLNEAARWIRPLLAHERSTPTLSRCRALRAAGMLAYLGGDFDVALAFSHEALELAERFGDEGAAAAALWVIGYTQFYRGNYAEADPALQRSLEICRRIGHRNGTARALYTIGWRCLHENRPELRGRAREAAEESLQIFRAVGDRHATVSALRILAATAYLDRDYEEAAKVANECLAIPREVGCRQCQGFARQWLSLIAVKTGDFGSAAEHVREAILLDRRSRSFVGARLASLALLLSKIDRHEEAATFAAAGRGILDGIGYAGYPWENEALAEAAEYARSALGDDRFGAASDTGRALAFDDAVDSALKLTDELIAARTALSAVQAG